MFHFLTRALSRSLQKRGGAFRRSRAGNVGMIFALTLIPMTIASGAGIDIARTLAVRNKLYAAVDAAALAVASNQTLTTAQQQTLAQQYFSANYGLNNSLGTPTPVTLTVANQTVTVATTTRVPTTLMAIVGIGGVNLNASSKVVWGQTKLWVSLVLDNTGSMTQADSTGTTKISALKTATGQLLTMLQNASASPGDVQVALIPFSKTVNVGTTNVNASWLSWTDWAAPPANGLPTAAWANIGPSSACPYSSGANGYTCQTGSSNASSTTATVPASGLICPSIDSGSKNAGRSGRYYNGCYDSVGTPGVNTSVNTTTAALCTNKTSCTVATYCVGYPNSATTTSGSSTTVTASTCACVTTSGTKKTCTATHVATTTTPTVGAPWTHTWQVNNHSTWGGCVMDRDQSYDVNNTTPGGAGTLFPTENAQACVPSVMMGTMSYNWSGLNTAVNNMTAGGSTNQTIGLQWGWQAQTGGAPLSAPTLPPNTSQFIILVSDGLNTQDRWTGDGSNQDPGTDGRMAQACTNAKAAGFVIYTVFVDLAGTQGNSTVLQNCASDSGKYFDLTTSGAIISTLNLIGQQITNLRVSQ